MDTLWASLIGLFVIALAVVLAFNLLQGRQTRIRDAWRERLAGGGRPAPAAPRPGEPAGGRSQPAPRTPADAPAPARRIEPTLGPASADDGAATGPAARAPAPQPARETEPRASLDVPLPRWDADASGTEVDREPSAPTSADAPYEPQSDRAAGPVLDARLDCIVAFATPLPIASERLLAAASTLRRAGSKPVAVEVDAGDGRWRLPHASMRAVHRVRAGVQLANRHGPLNAMEFSEFASAMQALGRSLGAGGAIVPEMAPVLEHARQLDGACAHLDAVIGLNVETPSALSPGELAALAAGLDLHERGNNRFAALGDDGETLFSLALGERAEQLTLLLDVPRAPFAVDPWAQMVACAGLCAERTGGRVVDAAGRPMNDGAAAEVARQLAGRYRSLEEAGLDAGSPAALRVFN
jgi:hypothetical protein